MEKNKKETLPRLFYSPVEVAQMLGVSRATVYRLANRGVIRSVTMPGTNLIKFPAESIEDYLAAATINER